MEKQVVWMQQHVPRRAADNGHPLTSTIAQLFWRREKPQASQRHWLKKKKQNTKKLSISDNCNLKNTSKDLYSSTKRWTSVLWQWWESAATLTRDFKEPTTAEQVMWLCREMTATQTSQPVPELRGDFCEKRYSAISFPHFERKHSLW